VAFTDVTAKVYTVLGVNPVNATEWLVTDAAPDALCVPYVTTEVDASSVVQVIRAVVLVMPLAPTLVIAGGGGLVWNVAFADVAARLLPLADTTSKLYVVLGNRFVTVTE
jgi:hypothetical protein